MAALVCDLCGGKLIMGAGGVAVCDSCGMEHSADRMKEKVQEIKGTVVVDNTHLIDNYLEMANNAYDADNNAEAESYCNKIIEIDPTNYEAWFLKGKAAGWQSTLQNSRLAESISAFAKAINNVPEEEKDDLVEEAKEQVINLSLAMVNLRAKRFVKWPDEEEKNGFISDVSSIISILTQFIIQAHVVIPLNDLMAPIAKKINTSVVDAYQEVIEKDYKSDGRPNDNEFREYIKRIGYCNELLIKAINLCDEDDESDIQRYENMIFLHKKAIDACSWEHYYDRLFQDWRWSKNLQLTEEAKESRRETITKYENKIKEIKEATAQKRIDEYWEEHEEEKVALESEKESIGKQLTELNKELANIPGNEEKNIFQRQINDLTAEKNALGVFKMKEKKAVQEKIDAVTAELKKVSDRMDVAKKEIENKINPLKSRFDEIEEELTKAR